MECEQGRLHQNAGFCRVDLEPLAEGGRGTGRLLVSTFSNPWFPLLRFEIGDIGRPSSGPCPCGRTLGLALDAIEGRLVSVCQGEAGRLVTHGAIDEAIARAEGVAEYRLRQVSPAEVRVAVVPEDGAGGPAVRASRSTLRELFGTGIEVNVEQVKEIAPEASGKFLLARREYPLGTDRLLAGKEAVHA
jgi:phenylacetate-CoA ligase